jgi:transposase
MIFSGAANALLVNRWFEEMLLEELRPGSTIIWNNAAFHKNADLQSIAQKDGHFILFLPPYSPDFNPIGSDFANLKKYRQGEAHALAPERLRFSRRVNETSIKVRGKWKCLFRVIDKAGRTLDFYLSATRNATRPPSVPWPRR